MAGAAGDPVAASFQAPAGQNIDNAKADALNNIAQSGAKGAAQMAATAQANAAARTQALQNAMAYSALRGAPAGNVDAAQATVAQPFDQRASVLGLMKDNYAQNNQAMQQANTNYMDGVKAGLPIAQTALDRTISNNQAANAAKRDQQNYELSLKQQMADDAHQTQDLSRQIAQARLQAIQDKANASKELTPAEIIARAFGPPSTAGDAASQYIGNERAQMDSANNADHSIILGLPGSIRSLDREDMGAGVPAPTTTRDAGAAIDQALGLPPGTTAALADDTAKKDTAPPPSDAAIRSSDQYAKGSSEFSKLMTSAGADVNAKRSAITALVTDVGADVARVVMNDYATQSKLIGP